MLEEKLKFSADLITQGVSANSDDSERWKLIRSHRVFHEIQDEELGKILLFFRMLSVRKGQLLIQEGLHASSDLFLILDGNLEVSKKDHDEEEKTTTDQNPLRFTIAKLTGGDLIGEITFMTGDPRSASIKSTTRSELLAINSDDFHKIEQQHPESAARLMKNIARYIAERVRQTTASEVKTLRIKLENSILHSRTNLFFSYVIGLLCFYNLALNGIMTLSMDVNSASLVSAMLIMIFGGALALMVRQSKLPLDIVGLTTKQWKRSVKESVLWTIPVILLCIGAKWALIRYLPKYNDLPLFEINFLQQKHLAFNFLLYGVHSPIQEFIARGVLQGSLQHYFTGKNVTLRAIIVSNALFSATHVHLVDGLLGIAVFIPGLFWGWLYARHENLIGVSISHLLIGWTVLFILNFESLFQ